MRSVPEWARRGRESWRYTGKQRPPFAENPSARQESVWDYPRPPAVAADARRVLVRLGSVVVADSRSAVRVLETASPPTFYVPPSDVDVERLSLAEGSSRCEWKGESSYWHVEASGERRERAAWSYPRPFDPFGSIAGFYAFLPAQLECFVSDRSVQPQDGGFYGGWITPELVGPFKGAPGSESW